MEHKIHKKVLPAIVPPVPVENVTALILPSVCCHISGPVISKCALLLDMLSNYTSRGKDEEPSLEIKIKHTTKVFFFLRLILVATVNK